MFTCSWRGVWKMFKYFFILAFDFFSEYDLYLYFSLSAQQFHDNFESHRFQ